MTKTSKIDVNTHVEPYSVGLGLNGIQKWIQHPKISQ